MSEQLAISEFQSNILALPQEIQGIGLCGGKGGAKSWAALLKIFQHTEIHGPKARALVIRRHYPDLEGLTSAFIMILSDIYGPKEARRMYNGSDSFFRLPNGGYVQFGGLSCELDLLRYRGRSWTAVLFDESGMYDSPKLISLLRAELRGPEGLLPLSIFTCNPGLVGHAWNERFLITDKEPWQPWIEEETGQTWITCPSTANDNPFLDVEAHHKSISAIASHDPSLAAALISGNFSLIKGGEYFGSCWSEKRSVIHPWNTLPDYGWSFQIFGDHGGGASPTVFYLTGLAMENAHDDQGNFFPRGSLILIDEFHNATEESGYTETTGTPISENCKGIRRMCDLYEALPRGYADPQILQNHGADSRLVDIYRENGVFVKGWAKNRRAVGAAALTELMYHADIPSRRTKPGLYICAQTCPMFMDTVPRMARDPRDRSLPLDGNDHAYDAAAAASLFRREQFAVTELRA